jgi:hypothetical protein
LVNHGVRNIANSVDAIVRLTERATFAFAKKTTTFEAVPPGHDATKINPTAISLGKLIDHAKKAPQAGMIRNCETTPIPINFGSFHTLQKSVNSKVIPMPSIIIPNPTPIASLPYHRKYDGSYSERMPTITAHKGNN